MNVAFIPVRGGSKSIPLKNIKIINGRPLVYWTVAAGCDCKDIDVVYVATDSEDIKKAVDAFCSEEPERFAKVKVIGRSAESASDTASTESAMLEFAEKYTFDNIVLIQATSPLLKGSDLDEGFKVFTSEGTDSVLSVVPQKRFTWAVDEKGVATPTNYDVYNRPRRQDFDEYYVENGAFYICSRKDLLRTGNRVSGVIRIVPMDDSTFYEIDEPSDWVVVEALMKKESDGNVSAETVSPEAVAVNKEPAEEKAEECKYKMLLTDCDGCLTDGGMYYSEKGDELKRFNTRDGVALGILRNAGFRVGMITGEDVELNRRRCRKLKMDIYAPGCTDKLSCINRLCDEYGITADEIIYVGDEINDYEAIKAVGLSFCPADAHEIIKGIATHTTKAKGGEGVIREVVDYLIANNHISSNDNLYKMVK